jgi:hypothetical protein
MEVSAKLSGSGFESDLVLESIGPKVIGRASVALVNVESRVMRFGHGREPELPKQRQTALMVTVDPLTARFVA